MPRLVVGEGNPVAPSPLTRKEWAAESKKRWEAGPISDPVGIEDVDTARRPENATQKAPTFCMKWKVFRRVGEFRDIKITDEDAIISATHPDQSQRKVPIVKVCKWNTDYMFLVIKYPGRTGCIVKNTGQIKKELFLSPEYGVRKKVAETYKRGNGRRAWRDADEESVDEECVDEECVDEECVDEECVDEESVDEKNARGGNHNEQTPYGQNSSPSPQNLPGQSPHEQNSISSKKNPQEQHSNPSGPDSNGQSQFGQNQHEQTQHDQAQHEQTQREQTQDRQNENRQNQAEQNGEGSNPYGPESPSEFDWQFDQFLKEKRDG